MKVLRKLKSYSSKSRKLMKFFVILKNGRRMTALANKALGAPLILVAGEVSILLIHERSSSRCSELVVLRDLKISLEQVVRGHNELHLVKERPYGSRYLLHFRRLHTE
jgi:hypothetical protein